MKEPKLWDNVVDLRPTPAVAPFATQWFVDEAVRILKNESLFEQMRKVHALRESAGVKSAATGTVMVRTPPRYFKPEAEPSPPKTFATELPSDD